MFKLFIQGGPGFMTILTVLLVAIFFAAWKAPRWIKEIGSFALVFGFLTYLIGLIPVFYGVIIYLISLVVRLIKKPRL